MCDPVCECHMLKSWAWDVALYHAIYTVDMYFSDVVLDATHWPRGASGPNFYGLGLGLKTYGLGLEGPGLGLERCIEIFF